MQEDASWKRRTRKGCPLSPARFTTGNSSTRACGPLLLVRISSVGALYRIRRLSASEVRKGGMGRGTSDAGVTGAGGQKLAGLQDGSGDGNDGDERWRERVDRGEGKGEGRRREGGCTASSKVGKKPRKGLCLVRGPVGGRKLRVFLCPPTRLRDRWSFPARQYMSRGRVLALGTSRVARRRASVLPHPHENARPTVARGVWWPLGAGDRKSVV